MQLWIGGYLADEKDVSGKVIIKSVKGTESNSSKEVEKEKILDASNTLMELLPELLAKYGNEVPYTTLHEETGFDFELIQVAVMHLIMTQSILGFINDRSTSDLSDDILIIREKRIMDEIEPEYRTGWLL